MYLTPLKIKYKKKHVMSDKNPKKISSRQCKVTEKVLMVFDENILKKTIFNLYRFIGGIIKEEM